MKRKIRKNLVLVLITLPLLFAFQCDEDYNPDQEVENLGLIEIEGDNTLFSVGDFIFIKTSIGNEQVTKDEQTINLRDYLRVDVSDLNYDLQINKIGLDGEETSYVVTEIQEMEGAIFVQDQPGPFFNIISPYDETKASFFSRIGIKLLEPGAYVLKTTTIKDRTHVISFDTQSSLGTLQMITGIANSDTEGTFRFTVK